jgi:hypothetical protein
MSAATIATPIAVCAKRPIVILSPSTLWAA